LKHRAFIPIESQPLEAVENSLHQFGAIALGVGVFNAQDEFAARGSRE
jgi:hypothetical protein